MAFQTFFYIGLGVIPSLVWLLFYLQEDAHPEPKTLLLQVFFLGMAAAPLARELEKGFLYALNAVNLTDLSMLLVGVAIIEEFFKFLVVRIRVLSDPDFDEPVDAMIYMVVSALGFAALENIFYLLDPSNSTVADGLTTTLARFVSATLFHALASGIMGYWLARAVFAKKLHWGYAVIGFSGASLFHILFNFLMLKGSIITVGIMILAMAFLVTKSFESLRNKKMALAAGLQKDKINF